MKVNIAGFPLHWEVVLILDLRIVVAFEYMRFQSLIRCAFHQAIALVPTTFVNGEDEDYVLILWVLVSIGELFRWAECGRPDTFFLRYKHARFVLTLHNEEFRVFIHRRS